MTQRSQNVVLMQGTTGFKELRDILTRNFVSFLAGVIIALVAAIPSRLLDAEVKFVVIIALSIVSVGFLGYRSLRLYLDELIEARNALELEKFIPRTFRVLESKKVIYIVPEREGGFSATIDRVMTIQNISSEKLRSFSFMLKYSVYEGSPKIHIQHLQVGSKVIPTPNTLYQDLKDTIECAIPQQKLSEQKIRLGRLQIPLTSLQDEGLTPKQKVEIRWKYSQAHIFDKLLEKEFSGYQVIYPTDEFEIEVIAPKGFTLGRQRAIDHPDVGPRSIVVRHLRTEDLDMIEMERQSEPDIVDNGKRMTWKIKEPKLGYWYEFYFVGLRSGSENM